MAFPSDLVRTKAWGTEVLTSSDLHGQLDLIINWVMAALNATTGHTHDGTSNQGPEINITNLTVGSQAQGDLIYASSASAWARLAKGTALQKLRMNSGATAPEWADDATLAAQSDMETATSITTYVSPGRTQYHPGVAKAYIVFDGSGTPTASLRYNTDASITDNGTGDYTISITTDFSSANWAPCGYAYHNGNTARMVASDISGPAAGTLRINTQRNDGTLVDATHIAVIGFGDQA